jgi:hypothetical protein
MPHYQPPSSAMPHYLITFDEADLWGDDRHRYPTLAEAEARFLDYDDRRPLVRLLRWDDFELSELRRAEVFREVTPRGYIGHFPNSHDWDEPSRTSGGTIPN